MLKIGNYYTFDDVLVRITKIEVNGKSPLLYHAKSKDGEKFVGGQRQFKAVNLRTCELQAGDDCEVLTQGGRLNHRHEKGSRVTVTTPDWGYKWVDVSGHGIPMQLIPRNELKLLPGF